MRSLKTPQGYLLRFEKAEEVVSTLMQFCTANDIRAAGISAIGALAHAELGFYDIGKKQFLWNKFDGEFELVSGSGNISVFQEEIVVHMHAVIADREYRTFGGHLRRGIVGATCEMILSPHDVTLEREFNEDIGLNLWKL